MDPDQARQNVGPEIDPKCLTLMVFLEEFFEKADFEKNQQTTKSMKYYPVGKELNKCVTATQWDNMSKIWSESSSFPYFVYVSTEGSGKTAQMHCFV